ncbi:MULTISPECIES: PKD domain-containing protein [unclassified Modestobacter]|uniref:PKD domain-containing protein n=1 Tax=unclassified Modestobacter TaxID=2643866 RepID=UPI0022AB34E6|nr:MULTISPECIES: PKD domain-containing protein [unclassified Modestobacter]MCZ2825176.1 PKD domain-containing protein [Modestobacter sp. VKM Ac-2981]MCZ2853759.1 PKD domain-containing protein [Modestobacter sp. VKM Ac-2982]
MRARSATIAARITAGAVGLTLAIGALGAAAPTALADSAPADPTNVATPATVTADALPTVQINGVAWSQVVVGNTVYVAGKFTSARPAGAAAGTRETVRNNMLAYDIRTGELITSFAPDLNAQALAVSASPDGSRVYVAGDFTVANGQTRKRVAAYDTATGQLVTDFKPSVSGQIRALAATGSAVYLGGSITAVGTTSRTSLAAVSAADGALLPWSPVPGVGPTDGNTLPNNPTRNAQTSTEVMALLVTGGGSQVVAGGAFDSLNGVKATGVGALDAVSGATRPFAVNQLITNQGVNSAVYSLSAEGDTVYGTAYDYYGPGNMESAFAARADGGALVWASTCRGDSYSNHPSKGVLYLATHAHQCVNIGGYPEQSPQVFKYATALSTAATGTNGTATFENANFARTPAPTLLPWYPTFAAGSYTGQYQAGWSVTGNGQYVVYAGEFPRVNGTTQQGLARFTDPANAPNAIGPDAALLTPTATTVGAGAVRVSWTATADRDNENLTYRVYRDGDARPFAETTQASQWWRTPSMAVGDTGLSAGSHTYRVTATDPMGNVARSALVTATVAESGAPRPYADVVRADGASDLWSLGEASGTTAYDLEGSLDMTLGSAVTQGAAGALVGDPDTAYTFSNSSSSFASTGTAVAGPQTFTVEAGFRSTSKTGGRIVGFGNSMTGTSTAYDRIAFLDTSGRVNFGVYDGRTKLVTSTESYNDGTWHHVAATLSPRGLVLYVDGKEVASRTDAVSAQPFNGYWRIGADNVWSGARTFTGSIDEVAVYPTALTAAQIANHVAVATTGRALNQAPNAAFTAQASYLDLRVDATGSSDVDGTVTGYAWDFGDGSTAGEPTATHTYRAAGTYAVTLTVTDDRGATTARMAQVTVDAPPPNVAPTAAFTAVTGGRTGTFDGTASTDSDGTVVAHDWDFGDGSTGTGATASHDYTADGTYTVTLTVTDDDGATTSTQQQVTIVTGVLAADAFGRSVTGGLGTADTGGVWTASAGAVRQSVSAGTATFAMTKGTNTGAYLGAVSSDSSDVHTAFSLSSVPTGGGAYLYVRPRQVAPTTSYSAQVRVLANGTVGVSLVRFPGSTDAVLLSKEVVVPGLTYRAGMVLHVAAQAAGTGTTDLSATVWADGTARPSTPTVTASDSTAALQGPGGVGLSGYLSGSATSPVAVAVTAFTAVPVGASAPVTPVEPTPTTPTEPTNTAPVAAFTSAVDARTASVDGSGSTDADGTVTAHAWDFGDGSTGTGATATHTYAADGTYTVVLTVTDDDGATSDVRQTVTVTAPQTPTEPEAPTEPETPTEPVLAADDFTRSVTGGLGTADAGGTWTASAGATRQSVADGTATFALTRGTNTGAYLSGVSQTSADVRTSFSLSSLPTGGGASIYVGARRVDTNQAYQGRVRVLSDGRVGVSVVRLSGSTDETLIGQEVVLAGLTYVPGTELEVRVQASGTEPTALAVTVWVAGTTEPATPTVTATDSTAALQSSGAVGLTAYLSGSATAPVDVQFRQLTVTPVG